MKNRVSSYLQNTVILTIATLAMISCATSPVKEEKIIITGSYSLDDWKIKSGWEHFNADEYSPGSFLAEQIGAIGTSTDYRYLLFAGSWCGDSKTEVPKIYKLFEIANIETRRLELYGVDRDKHEASGIAEQFEIEKVPTLIILKNNKESGRIVEFPQASWEEDIFKILIKE